VNYLVFPALLHQAVHPWQRCADEQTHLEDGEGVWQRQVMHRQRLRLTHLQHSEWRQQQQQAGNHVLID
jgi:hypothetical protein